MNSSATSSSSRSSRRGGRARRSRSSVRATTSPASAICSISRGDLRMITRVRTASCSQRVLDLGEDLVHRPVAVDADEQPARAVVARPAAPSRGGRRARRRSIASGVSSARPSSSARFSSRSSATSSGPGGRRRRRARGRSRRASRRAPRPGPSCAGSRRGRSRRRASSSVEPLADQRDRQLVGDELAALEERLHPAAERRPGGDRGAEHVARGDVREAVLGRDALRLRALCRSPAGRGAARSAHAAPRDYLRKPS